MLENYTHVNKNKTKLLCIRGPYKRIQLNRKIFLHLESCYNCSCLTLAYSPSVKYLGLHIDEFLNRDEHIYQVCKKLRTVSAYIYKLRDGTNRETWYRVYQSFAESILRYSITVYGSCPITKQKKINKLFRRIVRNIAYATSLHEKKTTDITNEMGILNFGQLFSYAVLYTRYYLKEFKMPVIKCRTLRQKKRFHIPRIFTNYGKNRQYYVPFLFNAVPAELLNLSSVQQAEKVLKNWCLELT